MDIVRRLPTAAAAGHNNYVSFLRKDNENSPVRGHEATSKKTEENKRETSNFGIEHVDHFRVHFKGVQARIAVVISSTFRVTKVQ